MRAPFLSSFFSLGARFPMGRAGDAAGAALVGPSCAVSALPSPGSVAFRGRPTAFRACLAARPLRALLAAARVPESALAPR
uniref:Putative secreted protein n=1 Tax=Ixodes ricinus TaxID=34613 RepID=A0A6B0U6G0_IXORI